MTNLQEDYLEQEYIESLLLDNYGTVIEEIDYDCLSFELEEM